MTWAFAWDRGEGRDGPWSWGQSEGRAVSTALRCVQAPGATPAPQEPSAHSLQPPFPLRLYGIKQQYAQAVIYMEAVNDFS